MLNNCKWSRSLVLLATAGTFFSCDGCPAEQDIKEPTDGSTVDGSQPLEDGAFADAATADLWANDGTHGDRAQADAAATDSTQSDSSSVDGQLPPDGGGSDGHTSDGHRADGWVADVLVADSNPLDNSLPDTVFDANLPDHYTPYDGGCADDDHDGVCNTADLCVGFDDHSDADADGVPDGCDSCPHVSGATCPSAVTCDSCAGCSTAIQSASAGQTVRLTQDIVAPGTESACVSFAGKDNVIFDCAGFGVLDSATTYNGIHLGTSPSDNAVVKNCTVRGFKNYGIYVVNGSNNLVSGCLVEENGVGIDFYQVNDSFILDNLVRHNSAGIGLRYSSDNNLVARNRIVDNHSYGIMLSPRLDVGDPENNQIVDNYLRTRHGNNIEIAHIPNEDRSQTEPNSFSATQDCSNVNTLGCPCTGGNYWATTEGDGFSQTCSDADLDGFCDTTFDFTDGTFTMRDTQALAEPLTGCCANPDRDGDGVLASNCGGLDCDDDPERCGSRCNPGQAEVCDLYDNNCDRSNNEGQVCSGDILYPVAATTPSVIQDQSCVENSATHQIYCFGGAVRASTGNATTDLITVYDPASDQLRSLQTRLPNIRRDVGCAQDSQTNRIYCFGGYYQTFTCTGWSDAGGCIAGTSQGYVSNDILMFNPADESLVEVAQLPTGLSDLDCVEHSGTHKIYCFGETDQTGGQFGVLEFTPQTNTLTVKSAALVGARSGQSCVEDSTTHYMYCFAGAVSGVGTVAEVVRYDPLADEFATMSAAFAMERRRLSCVQDQTSHDIFCFGGVEDGSNYFNEVVRYRPSQDSLTPMTARFPYGRHSHSCAQDTGGGAIYCFGGARNVVFFNQVVAYWP